MDAHPKATVSLSYQIPTYRAGKRRLYLGAWKHGVSLYGWQTGRDDGFAERHPDLLSGKATSCDCGTTPPTPSPTPSLRHLARAALDPSTPRLAPAQLLRTPGPVGTPGPVSTPGPVLAGRAAVGAARRSGGSPGLQALS